MHQYRLWQAPIFSFFSTSFYRDVGQHWKGSGLLYVLLLLCVSCTVNAYKAYQVANATLGQRTDNIVSQMPQIAIRQGSLSIDKESPHVVFDEDNQASILFDTSGTTTDFRTTSAQVLVTNDSLFIRDETGEGRKIVDFRMVPNSLIGKEHFKALFNSALWLLPLLWYAASVVGSFIVHAFFGLIYAIVGFGLAKFITAEMTFAGAMRIACMAMGTVIMLDTIVQVANLEEQMFFWRFFRVAISLFYLFFGIGANLSQKHGGTPIKELEYKDIYRRRRTLENADGTTSDTTPQDRTAADNSG